MGDGSVDALADRVAGALDQTGIGRAHLVGHSLGGAVALVLAEQHPERVASLTLIAPAGLGQQLDRNLLERLRRWTMPKISSHSCGRSWHGQRSSTR